MKQRGNSNGNYKILQVTFLYSSYKNVCDSAKVHYSMLANLSAYSQNKTKYKRIFRYAPSVQLKKQKRTVKVRLKKIEQRK